MQIISRYIASNRCYRTCKQILSLSKPVASRTNNESSSNNCLTSKMYNNNNFKYTARYFSNEAPPSEDERKGFPSLMDFPIIVWPSLWLSFKNFIFANFIIRPYLDREFNIQDFMDASKQAVYVISNTLSQGDFKTLKELVSPEAFDQLKVSVGKMSVAEREELTFEKKDIYFTFAYQIGVMFDESDNRWVEITMVYHGMRGLQQLKDSDEAPPMSLGFQSASQDKLFVCNYRFIRDYTKSKAENSSWIVNIVNHFKPVDFARMRNM